MTYEILSSAPFNADTTPSVLKASMLSGDRFLEVRRSPMDGFKVQLQVRSLADGARCSAVIRPEGGYQDAAVSGDGQRLALADDDAIRIIMLATGAEVCRTPKADTFYRSVVWLGDAHFVGALLTNEIEVFCAQSGVAVRALSAGAPTKPFHGMCLSGDGATLIHVKGGKVFAVDTASGEVRWESYLGTSPEAPAISPDDRYVAVLSNVGLILLSMTDGEKLQTGPEPEFSGVQWKEPFGESWGPCVAWNAGSSQVFHGAQNGHLWRTPANDFSQATEVPRTPDVAWINSLSPAGDDRVLIGTAHGNVVVFDAATGRMESVAAQALEIASSARSAEPAKPLKPANPVVAAIMSLLIPGVGQLMNGQTIKGLVILVVSVFTFYMLGLASILAALDAYFVARKRLEGGEALA
ncbi:MAG: PQQ-like beta-propeller repeat protein [Nannocystaceae bacterium]|nr:PQQ-like beta-propeller repeat protein [Nannocystaceae bacterium]